MLTDIGIKNRKIVHNKWSEYKWIEIHNEKWEKKNRLFVFFFIPVDFFDYFWFLWNFWLFRASSRFSTVSSFFKSFDYFDSLRDFWLFSVSSRYLWFWLHGASSSSFRFWPSPAYTAANYHRPIIRARTCWLIRNHGIFL